jgi:hypothetical protein
MPSPVAPGLPRGPHASSTSSSSSSSRVALSSSSHIVEARAPARPRTPCAPLVGGGGGRDCVTSECEMSYGTHTVCETTACDHAPAPLTCRLPVRSLSSPAGGGGGLRGYNTVHTVSRDAFVDPTLSSCTLRGEISTRAHDHTLHTLHRRRTRAGRRSLRVVRCSVLTVTRRQEAAIAAVCCVATCCRCRQTAPTAASSRAHPT